VIGIEDRDEVRLDLIEGVVHVAGLGMLVGGTGQVARPERGREAGDVRPVAVVEDPRLMLDAHRDRRGDRRDEDLGRFVVGRDQDGDPAGCFANGVALRQVVDIPQREGEQRDADGRVDLEDEEWQRHPPHREIDGRHGPPHEVGKVDGQRDDRDRSDRLAPFGRFGGRQVATRERWTQPSDGEAGAGQRQGEGTG